MVMETTGVLAGHGLRTLASVSIDGYNEDVRDGRKILNHRLRKAAFFETLDSLREPLARKDADPLGPEGSSEMGRKRLEELLEDGKSDAARLIGEAIESFAADIALVTGEFLKTRSWKGVERIVIGGGFRKGVIGERCILRAEMLLRADGVKVELRPIDHHPDEAGLIGGMHLLPAWMTKGHDGMICVDLGGTNLRVGLVGFNLEKADDFSAAEVLSSDIWRHADDDPKRTETVETLVDMIRAQIRFGGKAKVELVPVVAIGCPGVIDEDGSIVRGAVNLPGGNWESERFNLARAVGKQLGRMDENDVVILMHNDAVVQGLSQRPWMGDVKRWGVMTIGTGLGNACFTNREA